MLTPNGASAIPCHTPEMGEKFNGQVFVQTSAKTLLPQITKHSALETSWFPAFAGMTVGL
jgi:hypothetical protein